MTISISPMPYEQEEEWTQARSPFYILNSAQNYPIQPDNRYFLMRIQIIFWIETWISEQFKSQRH